MNINKKKYGHAYRKEEMTTKYCNVDRDGNMTSSQYSDSDITKMIADFKRYKTTTDLLIGQLKNQINMCVKFDSRIQIRGSNKDAAKGGVVYTGNGYGLRVGGGEEQTHYNESWLITRPEGIL